MGILLVGLSVLAGAKVFAGADDTVAVWASRVTLPEGAAVSATDLVRREVHFSDSAQAELYLTAADPPPPGSTTTREIGPEELVPRAALATGSATKLVELPLSVAPEVVPATVRAGSVVDVWVTPDSSSPALDGVDVDAERIFQDVPVLAVPLSGDSLGPTSARQVIVAIAPAQASRLPRALSRLAHGTVVLTKKG